MKKLSQTAYKFNCCGVGSVSNQKKKKKSDFYFLKHSSLNNSVEVCRECVLLFCNALFHIHTATWICSGSSAGDLRVFSSFLCYRAATLEQIGRGVGWGEVFILSQAISVYSITVLTCCWFLFFPTLIPSTCSSCNSFPIITPFSHYCCVVQPFKAISIRSRCSVAPVFINMLHSLRSVLH